MKRFLTYFFGCALVLGGILSLMGATTWAIIWAAQTYGILGGFVAFVLTISIVFAIFCVIDDEERGDI